MEHKKEWLANLAKIQADYASALQVAATAKGEKGNGKMGAKAMQIPPENMFTVAGAVGLSSNERLFDCYIDEIFDFPHSYSQFSTRVIIVHFITGAA